MQAPAVRVILPMVLCSVVPCAPSVVHHGLDSTHTRDIDDEIHRQSRA